MPGFYTDPAGASKVQPRDLMLHAEWREAYASLMRSSRLSEADRANVNTLWQAIQTRSVGA